MEIELVREIDPFAVWDQRSQIPGLRSVMSLGLDEQRAEVESLRLINSVFTFLGDQFYGKDVLEIGTGIGRFTKPLSRLAASLITIDLSKEMIKRARLNCNGVTDLHFLRGSASHIPTNGTRFDWVFEVTVLLHMPDDRFKQILNEAKRVLKPDGKIFLCGPLDPTERRQIHPYAIHRTYDDYLQELNPLSIEKVEEVMCGNDSYTMLVAS